MNTKLDVELPESLIAFKKNIVASIKPFIAITARLENNLKLWQSKFAGLPYFPKTATYPIDSKGQAMFLLAQINFAELPKLENFPESGILQFYISSNDDVYGMCFEDQTKQDNFRVIYFPNIIEDENQLITDFSFVTKYDYLPLEDACALSFQLKSAPLSTGDYQFNTDILNDNDEFDIEEEYDKLFPAEGHKIGGYPYFTQSDPREYQEGYAACILLFQMDTDDKNGIMWGDCGVANFFIFTQDLKKKDFSKVLYNWDCC